MNKYLKTQFFYILLKTINLTNNNNNLINDIEESYIITHDLVFKY
jgi:hypothetical protein